MTKKLEELFGLPHYAEDDSSDSAMTYHELEEDAKQVLADMSNSDKIDAVLDSIEGFQKHDTEMDEIASKAIKTYEDLAHLGMGCSEQAAGKIFEVAANMLKVALEAKDAKVSKKLRLLDMKLKKEKMDRDALKNMPASPEETAETGLMSRSEIMRLIREKSVDASIEK